MLLGNQPFNFQCNPGSNAFSTNCIESIEGTSTELTLSQIPIVQDFEGVLWNFFGLPPKREINFYIKLAIDTVPIYMTPYHIAPTEMQ